MYLIHCFSQWNYKYDNKFEILPEPVPHDIPGDWFKGPF